MSVQLGLTGGIASGKSTVAALLAGLGAAVIDADALAREVVAPGSPGLEQIAQRFGSHLIHRDGQLDRAALGGIVFADPRARADLEAITHPAIARLRAERTTDASRRGRQVVVQDIPLLVELGMAGEFDLVLVVHAPSEVRVQRMIAERGMSEDEARARIAAQASDDQRRAVADVWLDNSGTPESLRAQVHRAWQESVVPLLGSPPAR